LRIFLNNLLIFAALEKQYIEALKNLDNLEELLELRELLLYDLKKCSKNERKNWF